jgi:hypothetical protein
MEPELIHIETHADHNPESIRGAGKAGTIAVPAAIVNAVEDALHGPGYHSPVTQVPITPGRLRRLLNSAESGRREPGMHLQWLPGVCALARASLNQFSRIPAEGRGSRGL